MHNLTNRCLTVHYANLIFERLLNKPCVNEVTLTRKKTTLKMLLASLTFDTILKGSRFFNAENLESLDQRAAKIQAFKVGG